VAFRSAGRWAPVMFLTGFFVSVFFSNDALFDYVYVKDQQDLNNIKVARSTVGAMFGTIEGKLREDRNAELQQLRDSDEWKTWQNGLSTILTAAEKSRDILQNSWNQQRTKLEFELAGLRKQEKDKVSEVATQKAKLDAGNGSPASAPAASDQGGDAGQLKVLQKREQDLLATISDLQQQKGNKEVDLANEDKTGRQVNGQRSNPGRGPLWAALNVQLTEIKNTLATRETELKTLRQNIAVATKAQENQEKTAREALVNAKASRETAGANLDTAKRELSDLQRSVKEAEGRYDMFMGQAGAASSSTAGASDMVLNVRRALTTFTGSGSRESFKTIFDGCSALTDMLEREPQTKTLIGTASCDVSAFAQHIDRLASFDEALVKYRKDCQVDDSFNTLPLVKDMVDHARTCAGISTLPFARIKDERNDIDRLEQENSPTTSHFERTISTLRRGDTLAWLALAIAFSIDFLVLIAAMIGARAAISPLVRDGHVASQADVEDLRISQNIDLKIYPNDPPMIRNQKTLLSVIDDDASPSSERGGAIGGSIVDLRHLPPELVAGISALLQTYTAKRLAQSDRHRPGVYRIDSSLVMQMTRDVGLYERDQQHNRTAAQWEQGYDVMRRNRWGSSFDDVVDPFSPTDIHSGARKRPDHARGGRDGGRTPPASDGANAAPKQEAGGDDSGGSGWSHLRHGDAGSDTKKFYN
jgi:hypothetical protein